MEEVFKMNTQPTEAEEQKLLIKWMTSKRIFFFAPTNENNTHKQNRKYAMIAEKAMNSIKTNSRGMITKVEIKLTTK